MDLNENEAITITQGSAMRPSDFQPRMTYERWIAEWAADWAAKRSSLPYESARDEIELALANAKSKPISASKHNAATFMRVAGKLHQDSMGKPTPVLDKQGNPRPSYRIVPEGTPGALPFTMKSGHWQVEVHAILSEPEPIGLPFRTPVMHSEGDDGALKELRSFAGMYPPEAERFQTDADFKAADELSITLTRSELRDVVIERLSARRVPVTSTTNSGLIAG